MTNNQGKQPRDWRALWAQLLTDMPFSFLLLGAIIGGLTLLYLFVPMPGARWQEVWFSGGVMWAMAWWIVALVCTSCGVRGLQLRLHRWRVRKSEAETAAAADMAEEVASTSVEGNRVK
ncbi:hypothetical protein [Ottowia sp.]|uniref:hypothetical protein n=1 Tax=Ottowia sp. TaxID=1898956 RepID=UPI0025E2E6C1|nr:hypothetical protein [Ottowia sp.]MBK6616610.1 hypothetical protein [Ottowia sp.]